MERVGVGGQRAARSGETSSSDRSSEGLVPRQEIPRDQMSERPMSDQSQTRQVRDNVPGASCPSRTLAASVVEGGRGLTDGTGGSVSNGATGQCMLYRQPWNRRDGSSTRQKKR